MSESNLFLGGIPTDIELKALLDKFGAPDPGLISYSEIEQAVNVDRDTHRFRTIVTRWRKKLFRDYNIDTAAAKNEGIRILTEPERVDESESAFGRSAKGIVRAHVRVRSVRSETLDTRTLKKHEHLVRATLVATDAIKTAARDYARALGPKEQRPQLFANG